MSARADQRPQHRAWVRGGRCAGRAARDPRTGLGRRDHRGNLRPTGAGRSGRRQHRGRRGRDHRRARPKHAVVVGTRPSRRTGSPSGRGCRPRCRHRVRLRTVHRAARLPSPAQGGRRVHPRPPRARRDPAAGASGPQGHQDPESGGAPVPHRRIVPDTAVRARLRPPARPGTGQGPARSPRHPRHVSGAE